MNETELEQLERSLRRLPPAAVPGGLEERLLGLASSSVEPQWCADSRSETHRLPHAVWHRLSRWWMSTAGAAALVLAAWFAWLRPQDGAPTASVVAAVPPALAAVEMDRQLVHALEGVMLVADGPPVRFRCFNWNETILLRDESGVIEVTANREWLEVVPCGWDVY